MTFVEPFCVILYPFFTWLWAPHFFLFYHSKSSITRLSTDFQPIKSGEKFYPTAVVDVMYVRIFMHTHGSSVTMSIGITVIVIDTKWYDLKIFTFILSSYISLTSLGSGISTTFWYLRADCELIYINLYERFTFHVDQMVSQSVTQSKRHHQCDSTFGLWSTITSSFNLFKAEYFIIRCDARTKAHSAVVSCWRQRDDIKNGQPRQLKWNRRAFNGVIA